MVTPPPEIYTLSVPVSDTYHDVSNLITPCAESAVNTSETGFSAEQLLCSSHVFKLCTQKVLHTRIWLPKTVESISDYERTQTI